MADEQRDPAQEAGRMWKAASQALAFSETLTPRDKAWLADITPEAVFGDTIVLAVSSRAAQEAVQGDLNDTLLKALNLVSGRDMIPAVKIVQDRTRQQAQTPTRPSSAPQAVEPPEDTVPDQSVRQPAQTAFPSHIDSAPVAEQAAAVARAVPERMHSEQDTDGESHQNYLQQSFADQGMDELAYSGQPFPDQPTYPEPATQQESEQGQAMGAPRFPMSQNRVERDPETHLNKSATFDTFVPGDSNRFARTVALAVAEGTGRDFNPLCIYGSSGLGKTHLLNAIGNYALVKDPALNVRYVTSEEFTNEFIEALQDTNRNQGQIAEFNRRYRQVDVLLIDDIQFLGGKDATLEQFFHTFNALHDANKRIVIASDVAPNNLKGFEDRLISRFDSGLTVDIKPPDRETRVAILRMMAGALGIFIPNEVFDLIAERFTENIRELEGALTRVTAVASLNNQPVTRTLAEQTLQDYFATDVEIKPTDIISQVAKYFHLTFDDLVGRTRTKNIALARQIAMYLAREMTSMSLVDIGEVFGGRDHTTVMHAYTRISNEMQEKREIYNYVMELTVRLKQPQNK
ncbi:chromosomal replication initiator protein DnaA [Bifidobacterium xylocopae]|uniref:Chromosomal replication initiator protein DnaA n=1 Tax=Bifidobacterium xylocopae TaxID=2493119 RepID=A0A366KEX0_9BIFI|nr:chromosomal replication initiator protein DnaA [Bifidobacterium xylocopae]RBP99663.1 chromosomal replication initiator protein DnaA [Bifidobacterium xylocopae]